MLIFSIKEANILLKSAGNNEKRQIRLVSYDHVPVPCCNVDINGFIRDCNELFATLVGYPKAALTEMSFLDLVSSSPPDIIQKALAETNRQTGVFSQRFWLKRKDADPFPAILNVKPLRDAQKILFGANIAIIDDTFNYRAIKDVEKDKQELKRKERLKNEFVAIASHELRTPIQPILGFALLAKRGTINQEQAWEGVLSEARRLQQLANDILDVSRIESDNLKYEFTKVKINELLIHAVDSLKTEMNKEISILIDHSDSERDLEIQADRSRMTQVISNIVGNAIKFTKKGTIRIESKTFPRENRIEIMVSDTAGGIPPDIMPRLFEKFVTKGHGEGNKGGTGLGLYISKAIVAAHGGDISAFNNQEGGATFSIKLPISRKE